MKVDELMRGDWVYLCGTPCRIKDIVDDGVINYEKDVNPIPLTTEILVKNGYSYNEIRDGWELIPNNGYGICCNDNSTFEFCVGVFDGYCGDIIYHHVTDIQYVHELQHIIKDCKLDIDIVL